MRSQFLQSPQLGGIGRRGKASIAPLAAYAAGGYVPPLVLDHVGDVYGVGGAVSSFGDTVTFARTSVASYFNASGVMQTAASGMARTGHHLYTDSTWTPAGLLLEPSVENLLGGSNDFNASAGWAPAIMSVVPAAGTGLDGTENACGVTVNSVTTEPRIRITPNQLASTTYCLSVRVHSSTTGHVRIRNRAPNYTAWFHPSTGTVGTVTGGTAGAISLDNGWYLFWLTATNPSSIPFKFVDVALSQNDGSAAAAGTETGLFSGVALEPGVLPTSYFQTPDATTGTRAADSLTIAAADVPGDFFVMTGFLDYIDRGMSAQQVLFNRETDASNLMKLTLDTSGANTGKFTLTVITAGTTVTLSTTSEISPDFNVPFRVAFGASGTELALAMDGTAETRVASGLPDLSAVDVEIGLHGTLSRFIGWSEDIGDTGLEGASSAAFFSVVAGSPAEAATGPFFDAEMNHVITYGQSLSMGIAPALSTSAAYDHQMFYRGLRAHKDYPGETAAEWYASLVDMVEASVETPTRGAVDTIKERIADEDGIAYTDHTYQLLGSNPGDGGLYISLLSKGTDPYNRMIEQVVYGKSLSAAAGKSYEVPAMFWIQGTSDYLYGTTFDGYVALLTRLTFDTQSDIKAASGQSKRIAVIGTQVATHMAAADNEPDIALAQLYCHENRDDYYLAAPLYFLPYSDQYHPTAEGERWLGAYLGLAYKRIVIDGEDWSPVRPISWVQNGDDLDVTFYVRGSGSLEWDTTQVAAQTNYGFELVNSGGSPLTINSVSITGTNTVRVTAAATIPAGAKLRYAWQGDVNKGLGNLRDNQGDTIVFDPAGANNPMHNWCVIFELDL